MKKDIKIICSILLVISILSIYPLTAFSYDYGAIDLDRMVSVKENSMREIHSINRENINRLKNTKLSLYKEKTDAEKLKELFSALDLELSDAQFETATKDLKLEHIESIRIETTYSKEDSEGKQTPVSKDEAMQIAEQEKADLLNGNVIRRRETPSNTRALDNSHSGNMIYSTDGCMKQQIAVIYTPNYNGTGTTIGRYIVFGTCQWLKTPDTRTKDAISLYSSDVKWANIDYNNPAHSLLVSYTEYVYDSNSNLVSQETLNDAYDDHSVTVSEQQGAFFEYNLPNNKILSPIIYGDISFLMVSVCRVHDYDDATQEISIGMRYIHLRLAVSFAASYSMTSAGLSVSWIHQPVNYDSSYSWDYASDYYR